jgi:geranylgeranyl diphosphate synthase type II
MSTFITKLKTLQEKINLALPIYLKQEDSLVMEAARYSVLAGGKRLRPVLLVAFWEALTRQRVKSVVVQVGCSIEYAHTFSLIHDDLPAIDNDDLRRGRATCHRQFDEATAILAGDYLYGYSLENLGRVKLPVAIQLKLMKVLAGAMRQVIMGEMLDILGERKQLTGALLNQTFTQKTAALFQATLMMAVILARQDSPKMERLSMKLGLNLGMAFQIQDDVLGMIGEEEVLGKAIGADEKRDKSTWVKAYGLEQAQVDYHAYYRQARKSVLEQIEASEERDFLLDLIIYLQGRNH